MRWSGFDLSAPQIRDHRLRRVVARRAGDSPSRMSAGAAQIEAGDRHAVISMAQHWPCREQLVERQRAVKNVAVWQPEGALEIERRKALPRNNAGLESRRIGLDRIDHQVGDRLAVLVP